MFGKVFRRRHRHSSPREEFNHAHWTNGLPDIPGDTCFIRIWKISNGWIVGLQTDSSYSPNADPNAVIHCADGEAVLAAIANLLAQHRLKS